MAQVVEHAHEEDHIELLPQLGHVVDRELPKLDLETRDFRRQPRLREIAWIKIDPHHAVGSAPFHLQRVEARVAADIEDRAAREVLGNGFLEAPPFDLRVIAQKVARRSLHAIESQVVKPISERMDACLDETPGPGHRWARSE